MILVPSRRSTPAWLSALLVLALAVPAATAELADAADMTPAAYAASKRACAYLAATQREDGSWNSHFGSTTGIVATCCLALMGAGNTPASGEYGQHVAKGLEFIIRNAQPSGLLYRQGMDGAPMYHHGLACLALGEAWGTTQDKNLRDVLKRAIDLILATQNQAGGWRYQPRISDDDVSVTVMQLMALRAAKDAGIFVPKDVIDAGIEYVKKCHNGVGSGKDGGFGYRPGGESGFSRSAAGVLSLQVAGNYRAGEVKEGVEYMLQFKPLGTKDVHEHYYYGQYYAAMGIYQSQSAGPWGRKAFHDWYPAIVNSLVATQQADGHWQGEYDQYATSMALLVLDLPFHYLPIYQR